MKYKNIEENYVNKNKNGIGCIDLFAAAVLGGVVVFLIIKLLGAGYVMG